MKNKKEELEKLIQEKFKVGQFEFDEENETFINKTEIELYLSKISENKYCSKYYFYDGYEIYLSEEETEQFEGNEETCKIKAIKSFNNKTFMNYPILCSNIKCVVDKD